MSSSITSCHIMCIRREQKFNPLYLSDKNRFDVFPTKGLCSKRRICFYRLGSELNFCSLLMLLSASWDILNLAKLFLDKLSAIRFNYSL